MSTSFTCPKCRMTSYNPMDAKHQFCGNCHQFFNIREPAVRDDLSTVTDMTWEEVEVLVDKIGISQDYRDMQITTQKAESFAESLGWFFHPSHPDGRGWHHPAREGHIEGIVDLYELDAETIAKLENSNGAVVGDKTANKLLKRLKDNCEVTFDTLIGGLGIPGCRKRTAQKLMKGGFETYGELMSASIDDLMEVDGIAEALASSIFDGVRAHAGTANALIDKGYIKIEEVSGPLKGLTFCITGSLSKPRKHIERDIVEAGGAMKGVSKSLSYLVLNDPNSTSSKAKKAIGYGVELISEDDLYEMM